MTQRGRRWRRVRDGEMVRAWTRRILPSALVSETQILGHFRAFLAPNPESPSRKQAEGPFSPNRIPTQHELSLLGLLAAEPLLASLPRDGCITCIRFRAAPSVRLLIAAAT